ncbi:lyase family protein [Thermoplasma sp.]|uniref:lyase family protein n=1 Tax=Thermoplasma sp. TaxID=1973142 RepID=UPI00127BF6B6|nr:lyase family protein [Thermoplasma sp.]KAA8921955.1 MAG: hypothetical protein F6Q11_06875 [Thermoplasma sp.]
MKLWAGGVQPADRRDSTETFVKHDIEVEISLLKYEILSLIAYHLDLAQRGVMEKDESKCVIEALIRLLEERPDIDIDQEDAHTTVENAVIKRCGKLGHNVRLYLSRNEQVHSNVLMFTIERCSGIISRLIESIRTIQTRDVKGLLPGTTHFMPAMPLTAATYANYIQNVLAISVKSLNSAIDSASILPYGYGSGYGSPNSGKLKAMSDLLGIGPVLTNPVFASSLYPILITSVSSTISQISITISRIAMDLIEYYRDGYISLPSEFTTGSSLMPNKRNPDYIELLQGIASLSSSVSVLSMMTSMNKTSGYHRDFQMMKDSYVCMVNYVYEAISWLPDLFGSIEFTVKDPEKLPESIFATGNAWDEFSSTHDWKESYIDTGRKLRENSGLKRYMPDDYIDPVDLGYLEIIRSRYDEVVKKWVDMIEKAKRYLDE